MKYVRVRARPCAMCRCVLFWRKCLCKTTAYMAVYYKYGVRTRCKLMTIRNFLFHSINILFILHNSLPLFRLFCLVQQTASAIIFRICANALSLFSFFKVWKFVLCALFFFSFCFALLCFASLLSNENKIVSFVAFSVSHFPISMAYTHDRIWPCNLFCWFCTMESGKELESFGCQRCLFCVCVAGVP